MKILKTLQKSQKGFTLLHILPIFVLIAAIGFVGGNVYQAQVKKQEAARQAAAAESKKQSELTIKEDEKTETEEVKVPEQLPEQKPVAVTPPKTTQTTTTKPKTAPTYTVVTIPTTNAEVGSENVVLTAKLPGTYQGVCKALVKLPDGNSASWFDAAFGPADTCSITISRSKLTAGTQWKFYMYFKSSDGLTKGEGGGNLFNL